MGSFECHASRPQRKGGSVKLEDYPTPLTDSSIIYFPDGDNRAEVVDCEIARDLERKLAMCRDLLQETLAVFRTIHYENSAEIVAATLEETK